jgi:hypothetical protein
MRYSRWCEPTERKVIGYLMGDGAALDSPVVGSARADAPFSVSADAKQTVTTGARRAREGLPPVPEPKAVREAVEDVDLRSPVPRLPPRGTGL